MAWAYNRPPQAPTPKFGLSRLLMPSKIIWGHGGAWRVSVSSDTPQSHRHQASQHQAPPHQDVADWQGWGRLWRPCPPTPPDSLPFQGRILGWWRWRGRLLRLGFA